MRRKYRYLLVSLATIGGFNFALFVTFFRSLGQGVGWWLFGISVALAAGWGWWWCMCRIIGVRED